MHHGTSKNGYCKNFSVKVFETDNFHTQLTQRKKLGDKRGNELGDAQLPGGQQHDGRLHVQRGYGTH